MSAASPKGLVWNADNTNYRATFRLAAFKTVAGGGQTEFVTVFWSNYHTVNV